MRVGSVRQWDQRLSSLPGHAGSVHVQAEGWRPGS